MRTNWQAGEHTQRERLVVHPKKLLGHEKDLVSLQSSSLTSDFGRTHQTCAGYMYEIARVERGKG